MKEKKIDLFEWWFYSLVLIASGIVLVFPISLDRWRDVLTISSILFFLTFFLTKKIPLKKIKSNFGFFLLVYIIIMAIQSFMTIARYGYNFYEFYYSLRPYLWFIVVLPLFYLILDAENLDRILLNIIRITVSSLALRTIIWSAYNFFGIQLFKNLLFEYGISWSRVGSLRIDATPLIGITIIGIYYLFEKTKKNKFLILLVFIFIYLLIITQTRTLLLGSILTIFGMKIFKKRKKNKSILIFIGLFFLILIGLSLGLFDKILNYLDLNTGIQGFGYRYYEFDYFFNLLRFGNWKFGLGILSSQNPITRSILFGNLTTPMYLDDLGIFGFFVQFGIMSIFLYLSLFWSIFAVMKQGYRKNYENYGFLLTGLLIYTVTVSIPLDIFAVQRSFSIPIILAFVGYIENTIKNSEKDKDK